jgi:hypothetical protein
MRAAGVLGRHPEAIKQASGRARRVPADMSTAA